MTKIDMAQIGRNLDLTEFKLRKDKGLVLSNDEIDKLIEVIENREDKFDAARMCWHEWVFAFERMLQVSLNSSNPLVKQIAARCQAKGVLDERGEPRLKKLNWGV